jgi:hypothetical protein
MFLHENPLINEQNSYNNYCRFDAKVQDNISFLYVQRDLILIGQYYINYWRQIEKENIKFLIIQYRIKVCVIA